MIKLNFPVLVIIIASANLGAITPQTPGIQHPIFDEMDSRSGGSTAHRDCVKTCDKAFVEKVKAGSLLTGIELLAWTLFVKNEHNKCISNCPS